MSTNPTPRLDATRRDPSDCPIGYEEWVVWDGNTPRKTVAFVAGSGSKEAAISAYLALSQRSDAGKPHGADLD